MDEFLSEREVNKFCNAPGRAGRGGLRVYDSHEALREECERLRLTTEEDLQYQRRVKARVATLEAALRALADNTWNIGRRPALRYDEFARAALGDQAAPEPDEMHYADHGVAGGFPHRASDCAGTEFAPEPERCPTCESDERDKLGDVPYGGVPCLCDDPWHRPAPQVAPEPERQLDDLDAAPAETQVSIEVHEALLAQTLVLADALDDVSAAVERAERRVATLRAERKARPASLVEGEQG